MPKMNLLVQKPQPRQITAGISSSRYKPNQRDWLVSVSGKRYRFNSSPVLKAWLAENGVEAESISKEAVARMLEEADGEVELALSLRQELAKSSVKKYAAMEAGLCILRNA